ncbi:hypothetical protein MPSEU_000655400 [Mayamaea pseudoterrestris]|nr:hypothetical protein MPSEU_000655400 [Mayamaea pseudoterrestris]
MTLCCCCGKNDDYYDDVITTKSDVANRSSTNVVQEEPVPQRMDRAIGHDASTTGSDRRTVAWMRNCQESPLANSQRPVELSETEAVTWAFPDMMPKQEEVQTTAPQFQSSATERQTRQKSLESPYRRFSPQTRGKEMMLHSAMRSFEDNSKPQSDAAPINVEKRNSVGELSTETFQKLDDHRYSSVERFERGDSGDIQDELDAIVLFLQGRDNSSASQALPSKSNSNVLRRTTPHQQNPVFILKNEIMIRDELETRAHQQNSKVPSPAATPIQMSFTQRSALDSRPRRMLTKQPQSKKSVEASTLCTPYRQPKLSPLAISEVDSGSQERYLFACRLLKAALLERENVLLPSEKTFLYDLLEETERAPSEAQLHAVETASTTLKLDPLFQINETLSDEEYDDKQHRFLAHGDRNCLQQRRRHYAQADIHYEGRDVALLPNLIDDEATDVDTTVSSSITYRHSMSKVASVARFDGREFPFFILGVTPAFKVGVLTPSLMESLRSFFPYAIADQNFWLKYSMQRDGVSLPILLSKVRTSKYTVLGVETRDGHVFGAFCSAAWRVQSTWFGNSGCFLWRLKRSRLDRCRMRTFAFDNEMEVYPYTGNDRMIQYCSQKSLGVGGGEFGSSGLPFPDEPTGIGFMIDGDLQGGETNSCGTFNNPRLASRLSPTKNEFDVLNLEVWTSTSCVSIEEAERAELHQHFVNEFDRED